MIEQKSGTAYGSGVEGVVAVEFNLGVVMAGQRRAAGWRKETRASKREKCQPNAPDAFARRDLNWTHS